MGMKQFIRSLENKKQPGKVQANGSWSTDNMSLYQPLGWPDIRLVLIGEKSVLPNPQQDSVAAKGHTIVADNVAVRTPHAQIEGLWLVS